MKISIIIRTLNEEKYLSDLLKNIWLQDLTDLISKDDLEVIIVDSGSTDRTLGIASSWNASIFKITRKEFSFGKSLNIGCQNSRGLILVFISGHCIPASRFWLKTLCSPIISGDADYVYGKQLGGALSYTSEINIFNKMYPPKSIVPQIGFYCNNANSAISRQCWQKYGFNEDLTGLEDMELGQRLVGDGGHIGYVAEACVFHYHNESWPNIRRRFEREAIALQKIMPQVHITFLDVIRYSMVAIYTDLRGLSIKAMTLKNIINIILYRYNQYIGCYMGNHLHRSISKIEKDKYFYPK